MEKVYIESTIPSYLTAKPTSNLVTSARQFMTRCWWMEYRLLYQLFTSDVVIVECKRGDLDASKNRLKVISDIHVLEITEEVISLAELLFKNYRSLTEREMTHFI
jgi:hypothetical protein